MTPDLPDCILPDGTRVPRLGFGTWHLGEDASRREAEVAAIRLALDLGMTLVDTAEMYGSGGAEEAVGAAIRGRREGAFVVSKFFPHHASRPLLRRACEASRARLGIETIDLYLYHWRGNVPLAETVDALGELVAEGSIRRWGVSNFDVADMEELVALPGGERVAANQVLYNLARRGPEFDLLPWCRARGIATMAYSPLDEGRLLRHRELAALARSLGIAPAQLALAWLARQAGVIAIPKAVRAEHVRENHAAAQVTLEAAALARLDAMFPPPRRKTALEMI
jgi:diketogulonate reductase-like aldo/keto reductase